MELSWEHGEALREFNESIGGPVQITIEWDPKKERWTVWAYLTGDNSHPKYRPEFYHQLVRRTPSGKEAVYLFTWCLRDESGKDIGYLPIDDRLFATLRLMDTWREEGYRRYYECPDAEKKERLEQEGIREIAGALAEKFFWLDRPIISMNPEIPQRGDWRATKPWR